MENPFLSLPRVGGGSPEEQINPFLDLPVVGQKTKGVETEDLGGRGTTVKKGVDQTQTEELPKAPASGPVTPPAPPSAEAPQGNPFLGLPEADDTLLSSLGRRVVGDVRNLSGAAASTLDKGLRGELRTGGDSEAARRVDRHDDVGLALEAAGLATLYHPVVWRRDPSVAVMVSGNAAAHVYLRPGVRRDFRWPLSDIEGGEVPGVPTWMVQRLLGLDGVALVAATEGDDVVVLSRDGRARLAAAGPGLVSYTPERGDPLRLGTGATLPPADWLEATIESPFPDAPVQLLQLFRSPRTGDLVLAAAPGADLRGPWEIPEHRSGHGSLVADHMRCLVAANRPLAGPLRTADLYPLILRHLGHAIPDGIDGVLPLSPVTAAGR